MRGNCRAQHFTARGEQGKQRMTLLVFLVVLLAATLHAVWNFAAITTGLVLVKMA